MLTIGDTKAYDVKELSELLDVSEKTIRDYCAQNKLKARKIGRKWWVTEDVLQDFIKGVDPKPESEAEPQDEED